MKEKTWILFLLLFAHVKNCHLILEKNENQVLFSETSYFFFSSVYSLREILKTQSDLLIIHFFGF